MCLPCRYFTESNNRLQSRVLLFFSQFSKIYHHFFFVCSNATRHKTNKEYKNNVWPHHTRPCRQTSKSWQKTHSTIPLEGATGTCCRSGSACWCHWGWPSSCPLDRPAGELFPPGASGSPRSAAPALRADGWTDGWVDITLNKKISLLMLHTLLKSSILKLLIIQNVPVEMKLH